MNDEYFYEEVVRELSLAGPIRGLWAKCFAECDGDERRAKALYIRLRVKQLVSQDAEFKRRQVEQQNAAKESALKNRMEIDPASGLRQPTEDLDLDLLYERFKGSIWPVVLGALLVCLLLLAVVHVGGRG